MYLNKTYIFQFLCINYKVLPALHYNLCKYDMIPEIIYVSIAVNTLMKLFYPIYIFALLKFERMSQ